MFQLLKSAKSLTELLTQDVMKPSLNKETADFVGSGNEDHVAEEQTNLSVHTMMNDEV